MSKKKRCLADIDTIHMSIFWASYHQAGLTPDLLVEIASRMKGGRQAIVDKAFLITVA